MVTHAALAAQRAHSFANGNPFVLAGDFNFKPDSSIYALLTTGHLEHDHPHQPPVIEGDSWRADVPVPLVSAYVSATGSEPDFTNLATTKIDSEPFVSTLDYIFLSDKGTSSRWRALNVRPLPLREEVLRTCKSYPTADEPSDHVAIWVDLELVDASSSADDLCPCLESAKRIALS